MITIQKSNGLGLPIVFLHDMSLGAKEQYGAVLTGGLGRRYQVYCIDFPGHGDSSKALHPQNTYTIEGLTAVVKDALKSLKLKSAVFVGSGMGAYILGHMLPELSPISEGFLMCDLTTPGVDAAAKAVGNSWWIQPADALQVKINAVDKTVGILDGAVSADLVALLNPRLLWRNAVQVVPGVSGHVAVDQPLMFELLVQSFMADILSNPVAEHQEPTAVPSVVGSSPPKTGPSRQKHGPGTMPNPMGRYEARIEDAAVAAAADEGNTAGAANPNRRGKVVPGTMPHPASRFDFVPDDGPEEEHPAIAEHQKHVGSHQNVRGRIVPGTMPHPSMRFELPGGEGHQEEVDPMAAEHQARVAAHANVRGRIVPGTMPHPGSRFELPVETADVEDEQSKLTKSYSSEIQNSNPNARGRVVGGTMPHPALRFEGGTSPGADAAGGHLKGGSYPHPDHRFHTEPGMIGETPSTRVTRPPGGFSSNIFG